LTLIYESFYIHYRTITKPFSGRPYSIGTSFSPNAFTRRGESDGGYPLGAERNKKVRGIFYTGFRRYG
jgi:hypothetical protein